MVDRSPGFFKPMIGFKKPNGRLSSSDYIKHPYIIIHLTKSKPLINIPAYEPLDNIDMIFLGGILSWYTFFQGHREEGYGQRYLGYEYYEKAEDCEED